MYGEIVTLYEIAVHFRDINISARGRGKPLPYDCVVLFPQPLLFFYSCGTFWKMRAMGESEETTRVLFPPARALRAMSRARMNS